MTDFDEARQPSNSDPLKKYLTEFPDLYYNGTATICDVCNRDLLCWDKYDCRRHVNSLQHKNNKNGVPDTKQFKFDLLLVLIACDVPMNILDKRPFQKFWNKYNPLLRLPSRASLRKYVPIVREDAINKMKSAVENARLWLCVDDTTDYKKNSVVNIMVRVLDPLKPTPPLLLASKRLTERTEERITQAVLETLEKFDISTSQVLMLVSDGEATMRLVGCSLQERGCTFVHVTCKVHGLHLVAEIIREGFPEVDALIASTDIESIPGIPPLPQPVLARWGTWLKEAIYYADYFHRIKAERRTKFDRDNAVETSLETIRKNYKGLADAMEKLGNSALPLAESLRIVDNVHELLDDVDDVNIERVRETFASVIGNDAGFARLRGIRDGASSDPLSPFEDCFNFACITSVDVERSFAKYKQIFAPQRTALTETSIETYLMLYFLYGSPVCDKDNQASSSS